VAKRTCAPSEVTFTVPESTSEPHLLGHHAVIYWLEDNPQYAKRVHAIYTRMQQRQDQLLTGAFTFGEVLAGLHRQGASARILELRLQLQAVVSEIVPFTVETADRYAQIRGGLGVSPADGIHLACAAQAGTDLFVTNHRRLLDKFVPGIQFIASIDDSVL
jgi:predicted nucleic acid-binding protein